MGPFFLLSLILDLVILDLKYTGKNLVDSEWLLKFNETPGELYGASRPATAC